MPTQQITNGKASVVDSGASSDDDLQLRELAVKQLERKRRFWMHAISYAAACVVLIVIWAITEYSNAGGWPTNGCSARARASRTSGTSGSSIRFWVWG